VAPEEPRKLHLMGNKQQVEAALRMVNELLRTAPILQVIVGGVDVWGCGSQWGREMGKVIVEGLLMCVDVGVDGGREGRRNQRGEGGKHSVRHTPIAYTYTHRHARTTLSHAQLTQHTHITHTQGPPLHHQQHQGQQVRAVNGCIYLGPCACNEGRSREQG
jgi:hypothetical protein